MSVELEQKHALKDAQDIVKERGVFVWLHMTAPGEANRDRYNSIVNRDRTSLLLSAWPVKFQPNQRSLEKVGIYSTVDVLIYLATKDLTDNDLDIYDIDLERWQVEVQGSLYNIKEVGRVNMFYDSFLNISMGLRLQ